jgi:hypothetical protein
MKATVCRVAPGPQATTWLIARIRAIQGDDPLAPVTVIVPTHHAGLHLRRTLAARGGYAAARFSILAQLAEMLGAVRLARDGRMPLMPAVRSALIRQALRAGGGPLGAASDHAGLVDLLAKLGAELKRRADREQLEERIRATSNPTSDAALQAVTAYERAAEHHRRYDDIDLLAAATEAVDAGEADRLLPEIGQTVVYFPDRIEEARAAQQQAAREGRPPPDVTALYWYATSRETGGLNPKAAEGSARARRLPRNRSASSPSRRARSCRRDERWLPPRGRSGRRARRERGSRPGSG